MNESKSFKNTLFHIFTLFFLVTLGRVMYDYKTIVYDQYQAAKKTVPYSGNKETFLARFYDSVSIDVLSLFLVFFVMSLLVARYNRSNRYLNDSLLQRTEELESKNRFLTGYIQALNRSTIVTRTDKKGVITYANDQFLQQTGYTLSEVIGKTHKIIRHPETSDEMFDDMWKTIKSKRVWSGIIKGLTKDKTTFINKVLILSVLDKDENIVEYLAVRTDITELIEHKEELERSFLTDSLTNLPNRNKLLQDLKKVNGIKCTNLALINIDSFKNINDFYGYEIADNILIKVASILQELAKGKNLKIYKLPSDEYAIFNDGCTDKSKFIDEIKNILSAVVATKLEVFNQYINIHFSTGIASEIDSIIIKADMALQHAKSNNKDIVVFDKEQDTESKISENIKNMTLLKNSVTKNQIVPFFQPIYNIESKKIEKYECLARIVKDDGTVIPPFFFIDTAIKSKLYPHITKSMVSKSFEFFKDKEYEFSINMSMEDIKNGEVVDFILDSLKDFKNPGRIVFEILETEEINNYDHMKEFIKKVKRYGCKIAIDDFGSGYSNFAHILELHIDYLKIDSSLVKNISRDKNARVITKTIINFANFLGMKTIAEFVEDKESMELLETMGANYIQGYYIGKPSATLVEE